MRIVVVGGGILGLSVARLAAGSVPGAEVVVLEKELEPALHQSARNSGVVHPGIYYEPGSLKARLSRRGMWLTERLANRHEIPYQRVGQVIVATAPEELDRLEGLERRARANGVPGIARVDATGLGEIEPRVAGLGALHSPETAITDFRAISLALAGELEGLGELRLGARVAAIEEGGSAALVKLADGEALSADRAIVCAGLNADRLARRSGRPAEPRIVPFRGEYWRLAGEGTGLVRGLVYPVPDPAMPFLGVHLTRHVDGSVLVGPNAVLAGALEGYGRLEVSPRELAESLAWPGTPRLIARHWRAGARELSSSLSRRAFARRARAYVPELRAGDLSPARAGVRAQAVDRDGSLVDDFRLDVTEHVAWVRNAPSPGATAAPAIAEELLERLGLAG